jgi:DNA-binding MurR/RpiR family transcriptional regulator
MSLRNEIRTRTADLTAAERKISAALLADYPFAGLVPIQELAQRAQASPPSVMRFVGKFGCSGYLDFQRRLIDELKEGGRSPIDLRATQDLTASDDDLKDYGERVCSRIREAMAAIPRAELDTICSLLADEKRNVFIIGGRITDMLAGILSMHLKLLRPDVFHIPQNPELWPDTIQQMRRRDVLVMFDFRRYQIALEALAEKAAGSAQPRIVLFTDKWLSPIVKHASHVVPVPIDVATAWDTSAAALTLVEAVVVKVSEKIWPAAQRRIEAWDRLRPAPFSRPESLEESSKEEPPKE